MQLQDAPAGKLKPGQPLPDNVRELFEKRRKYLTAGKANYRKADAMLEQILAACEIGVSVTLDPATKKGKPETHTLTDRFADTNQVWAGSSCRRHDVVVKNVKPQDEAAAAGQTNGSVQDASTAGRDSG
ncbi:MAG: hypothetical protein AAFV88_14100 [Planctomycetota bacterium]